VLRGVRWRSVEIGGAESQWSSAELGEARWSLAEQSPSGDRWSKAVGTESAELSVSTESAEHVC
jgi:hypothetical protein